MSDERIPLLGSQTAVQGEVREQSGITIFSVEFATILILFSVSLTDAVTSNLLLYRTCLNDLNYNQTTCDLLHMVNKSDEAKQLESEVQEHTTMLVMTLSIITGVMPAFLSAFLGAWSDRHGRKPLVLWPLLGQTLTSVLVTVYCLINNLSAWWFVICILPMSFLGGNSIISLGANLMIADMTNESNRSFRLTLLYGCGFIGTILGTMSSTYLYETVGFFYLYVVATITFSIGFVFTWFLIDESLENVITGTCSDLLDWSLLKETCAVNFKRRQPMVAAMLFFFISAYGITQFCFSGTDNVNYFFTRQKFQWLLSEYNILYAVNTVVLLFGMCFGFTVLQKVCAISDGILLLFSYLSAIADVFVRCVASASWHMYLAGAMSVLGALSQPLIKSKVAKIVPKEEVAKIYSLITSVESLLPVFSPLLFSSIYYRTLITFPSAVYALAVVLYSVCLIFIIIAEYLFYKFCQTQQNNDSEI